MKTIHIQNIPLSKYFVVTKSIIWKGTKIIVFIIISAESVSITDSRYLIYIVSLNKCEGRGDCVWENEGGRQRGKRDGERDFSTTQKKHLGQQETFILSHWAPE